MTDAASEVHVDIDVPDTPPDEPDTPAVVVVDTGDDAGGDDALEIGTRLGTLEAAIQTLTDRLGAVEFTAQDAQITADHAADEARDVVEEVAEAVAEATVEPEPEPDTEEDDPPNTVHWTHRRKLFKRGD